MKKVVLARVDDRLIHGEIVTVWIHAVGGTQIWIVDDKVAKDTFMKRMLKSLAPSGVAIEIFDVVQAAERLKEEPGKNEGIMLLSKTPVVFEALVREGVNFEKVNLGNMGLKGDRKPFIKNVAANGEERDSMRRLLDRGIYVYYQLVPEDKISDIKKLL